MKGKVPADFPAHTNSVDKPPVRLISSPGFFLFGFFFHPNRLFTMVESASPSEKIQMSFYSRHSFL